MSYYQGMNTSLNTPNLTSGGRSRRPYNNPSSNPFNFDSNNSSDFRSRSSFHRIGTDSLGPGGGPPRIHDSMGSGGGAYLTKNND